MKRQTKNLFNTCQKLIALIQANKDKDYKTISALLNSDFAPKGSKCEAKEATTKKDQDAIAKLIANEPQLRRLIAACNDAAESKFNENTYKSIALKEIKEESQEAETVYSGLLSKNKHLTVYRHLKPLALILAALEDDTQPCYRAHLLACLFGDKNNIEFYLKNFYSKEDTNNPLHDATLFSLKSFATLRNVNEWQILAAKSLSKKKGYAPRFLSLIGFASEISNIKNKFPKTAEEFNQYIKKTSKKKSERTHLDIILLEINKKTNNAIKKSKGTKSEAKENPQEKILKPYLQTVKNSDLSILFWYTQFMSYQHAAEHPTAARILSKLKVPEKDFDTYLKIIKDTPPKSSDGCLPRVIINGEDAGHSGYFMCKLSSDDPIGGYLGYILKNCQNINKQAHTCAVHGITQDNSGFYVLCKGKPPKSLYQTKGNRIISTAGIIDPKTIVAESWAWRSARGRSRTYSDVIVFDNIEITTNINKKAKMVHDLYTHLAAKLISQSSPKNPITEVRVGTGYLKLNFGKRRYNGEKLEQLINTSGKKYTGYSDANTTQVVIIKGYEYLIIEDLPRLHDAIKSKKLTSDDLYAIFMFSKKTLKKENFQTTCDHLIKNSNFLNKIHKYIKNHSDIKNILANLSEYHLNIIYNKIYSKTKSLVKSTQLFREISHILPENKNDALYIDIERRLMSYIKTEFNIGHIISSNLSTHLKEKIYHKNKNKLYSLYDTLISFIVIISELPDTCKKDYWGRLKNKIISKIKTSKIPMIQVMELQTVLTKTIFEKLFADIGEEIHYFTNTSALIKSINTMYNAASIGALVNATLNKAPNLIRSEEEFICFLKSLDNYRVANLLSSSPEIFLKYAKSMDLINSLLTITNDTQIVYNALKTNIKNIVTSSFDFNFLLVNANEKIQREIYNDFKPNFPEWIIALNSILYILVNLTPKQRTNTYYKIRENIIKIDSNKFNRTPGRHALKSLMKLLKEKEKIDLFNIVGEKVISKISYLYEFLDIVSFIPKKTIKKAGQFLIRREESFIQNPDDLSKILPTLEETEQTDLFLKLYTPNNGFITSFEDYVKIIPVLSKELFIYLFKHELNKFTKWLESDYDLYRIMEHTPNTCKTMLYLHLKKTFNYKIDKVRLKNILRDLSPSESIAFCEAVDTEELLSIFKEMENSYSIYLLAFLDKLNLEQLKKIFELIKDEKFETIKSIDTFADLMRTLKSDDKKTWAYQVLKQKIIGWIKSPNDFRTVVQLLNTKLRIDVYSAVEKKMTPIILSCLDAYHVLSGLPDDLKNDAFKKIFTKISLAKLTAAGVNHLLSILSANQRKRLFTALAPKLLKLVINGKDFSNIIEHLGEPEKKVFYNAKKNQLIDSFIKKHANSSPYEYDYEINNIICHLPKACAADSYAVLKKKNYKKLYRFEDLLENWLLKVTKGLSGQEIANECLTSFKTNTNFIKTPTFFKILEVLCEKEQYDLEKIHILCSSLILKNKILIFDKYFWDTLFIIENHSVRNLLYTLIVNNNPGFSNIDPILNIMIYNHLESQPYPTPARYRLQVLVSNSAQRSTLLTCTWHFSSLYISPTDFIYIAKILTDDETKILCYSNDFQDRFKSNIFKNENMLFLLSCLNPHQCETIIAAKLKDNPDDMLDIDNLSEILAGLNIEKYIAIFSGIGKNINKCIADKQDLNDLLGALTNYKASAAWTAIKKTMPKWLKKLPKSDSCKKHQTSRLATSLFADKKHHAVLKKLPKEQLGKKISILKDGKFTIRPIAFDVDIQKIMEIEQCAFPDNSNGSEQWDETQFRYFFTGDEDHCFVLEYQQTIIGYAFSSKEDNNVLDINNIAIDSKFHGLSLGEYMLQYMINHAASQQFTKIGLEVHVNNIIAASLYKKLGFSTVFRSGEDLRMVLPASRLTTKDLQAIIRSKLQRLRRTLTPLDHSPSATPSVKSSPS